MSDTTNQRIIRSKRNKDSNWKEMLHDEGEAPLGDVPIKFEKLAAFIHLSDIHICDTQSPARLEFLDRIADPDNPLSALVPYIGTYRAQEFLSVQVFEAMISAANKIEVSPLTKQKIDAVVITGDVVDNAQSNELSWYKTILDGGLVSSKSGGLNDFQGPHSSDPSSYDIHYYHPDGPPLDKPADRPHLLHDFPYFKGVTAAAANPFVASGLKHNWFAVHGNHDALLQGTATGTKELREFIVGDAKISGLSSEADLSTLFEGFGQVGPAIYPGIDLLETTQIVPDERRQIVTIEEWVATHTDCGHDHGLRSEENQISYWYRDIRGNIRLVGLDTVNRFGGWQGCIHREQFEWLERLLEESKDKYVILSSHHPLTDLFNDYSPEGELKPAAKQEALEMLLRFPNVILWFSGHVHDHKISEATNEDGTHAFWEIRTGSHIDWPQQSRVIEIVKSSHGKIAIGTVVFDHDGPLEFTGSDSELENPIALAGLSRMLAGNDWQRQAGPYSLDLAEGEPKDRNIWLWANDPLA